MDLRVDLNSGRVGDGPCGFNPVVLHVSDGLVNLRELKAFMLAGKLPAGRQVVQAIEGVIALDGLAFRDFVVSLHNLSTQSHRELAGRLFEQASLLMRCLALSRRGARICFLKLPVSFASA